MAIRMVKTAERISAEKLNTQAKNVYSMILQTRCCSIFYRATTK